MIIIQDSREQCPFRFKTPTEVAALPTADYSVKGLENRIAIERKELGDLCNSLGGNRERFTKELERSRALDFFAIIIEADFRTIRKGQYNSLIRSSSVIGSLLTFSIRYNAHIFFAGSHTHGAEICEKLLIKFVSEKEKILEAVK